MECHTINLHGIKDKSIQEISFTQLKRLHATKSIFAFYHLALSTNIIPDASNLLLTLRLLQPILQQFEFLLQEPQTLPSHRNNTHHIRPYRYSYYQKQEIKKLIQDMLQSGIIRCSTSAFSSLEYHATPIRGHTGIYRTFKRLSHKVFWEGLHQDIAKYIATCKTCQRIKYLPEKPFGLLQPTPLPTAVWEDICMILWSAYLHVKEIQL